MVIPNCEFLLRKGKTLSDVREFALKNAYTDVIIVMQRHKKPYGLTISHLPKGPTSFFHLSGIKLAQDIPNSVSMTTHNPELITKNFKSFVARRAARQLESLFVPNEEHAGRRVIVFQNQRDFIFFRHYRYVFINEGENASLAEIGPRFTLKLRSIQKGFLELKTGEYEFKISGKERKSKRDVFF